MHGVSRGDSRNRETKKKDAAAAVVVAAAAFVAVVAVCCLLLFAPANADRSEGGAAFSGRWRYRRN